MTALKRLVVSFAAAGCVALVAGAGSTSAFPAASAATAASDRLTGPESCWGKTCVPAPGDMVVYRLLDGPFAGKYVYIVENVTSIPPGQRMPSGWPRRPRR